MLVWGNVEVAHATFNFVAKDMVPGPFNGSYILDYDILFSSIQEGYHIVQVQVKFQDPEHPFLIVEVRDKMIGFGYYAEEKPMNVWAYRVLDEQKRILVDLGLDKGKQSFFAVLRVN